MTAVVMLAVVGLAACGPGDDPQGSEPGDRDAEVERLRTETQRLEAEIERLREQAPAPDGQPAEQPATPRSERGLVDQLRAYFPAGEELGYEPGPTPWEPAAVPPGFGAGDGAFDSPGRLMTALSAEVAGDGLGADVWEVTARVLFDQPEGSADADEATGALLLWGFLDDAVAGSDHRLALRRGGDGWFVDSAEQRSWCARGVSDGLCV